MPMKDAVKVFKALSDRTRLRIVLLLRRRELCVCELTYILGMEQSRVSHQMRVLREAGRKFRPNCRSGKSADSECDKVLCRKEDKCFEDKNDTARSG